MATPICARCNTTDGEFPFTLFGETGKIIRYRKTKYPEYRNKIVCYNCWEFLVYGSGSISDKPSELKQ